MSSDEALRSSADTPPEKEHDRHIEASSMERHRRHSQAINMNASAK